MKTENDLVPRNQLVKVSVPVNIIIRNSFMIISSVQEQ